MTSLCELGRCVLVVEPVSIASRSGFAGVVVHGVYIGLQPIYGVGLVGGCSLGRCLMGASLLWCASIACGLDGAAMMMSRGCHMGFHSTRYRMDMLGVSSSSGCVRFMVL